MKTSPFAPWSNAAPDPAPEADASANLLQQAAEQLSEAAARLASAEAPGASALSLQITVATPSGDSLPFTFDAGPDLTLL